MKLRAPVGYSASEIVRWHLAEEFKPGAFRPSRPCAYYGWRHFRQRLRLAWSVFTGRNDVLIWGGGSGLDGSKQVDCCDPRFVNAATMKETTP